MSFESSNWISRVSLEEDGFSGLWHLELCEQTSHEPVVVGSLSKVHVAFKCDIVFRSLGLDLADMVISLALGADDVNVTNEEGHWYGIDLGHVNEIGLLDTIEPLVLKLLEAILEAVHDPVLL